MSTITTVNRKEIINTSSLDRENISYCTRPSKEKRQVYPLPPERSATLFPRPGISPTLPLSLLTGKHLTLPSRHREQSSRHTKLSLLWSCWQLISKIITLFNVTKRKKTERYIISLILIGKLICFSLLSRLPFGPTNLLVLLYSLMFPFVCCVLSDCVLFHSTGQAITSITQSP